MDEICGATMLLLRATVADNVGHLYTIPVEWEYIWDEWNDPRNRGQANKRVVTRLSCVCGTEIDRLAAPTIKQEEKL